MTVATTRSPDRRSNLIDGVAIAEFDVSGNAVRGLRGDVAGYQDLVVGGNFDLVMTYAAQQWTTDALLPALDRIRYPRVLAPCGFSGLEDPSYAEYFRGLPAQMAKFDGLIFHSSTYRDIAFARRAGLEALTVVPNGADEREFSDADAGRTAGEEFRRRHGIPADLPMLLTVGSHVRDKGHALAIEALRRSKLDRAMLAIVGNAPTGRGCQWSCRARALRTAVASSRRKQVSLLSLSRADTVAAYHAADLFVLTSSIECSPLVLFEAMAAGTPFVSVAAGNVEEIVEWGEGGRIVPTQPAANGRVTASASAVAGAIDELIGDEPARRALGESGRRAWDREFRWEAIAARYEQLYEELVARRGTRRLRAGGNV